MQLDWVAIFSQVKLCLIIGIISVICRRLLHTYSISTLEIHSYWIGFCLLSLSVWCQLSIWWLDACHKSVIDSARCTKRKPYLLCVVLILPKISWVLCGNFHIFFSHCRLISTMNSLVGYGSDDHSEGSGDERYPVNINKLRHNQRVPKHAHFCLMIFFFTFCQVSWFSPLHSYNRW